jgi:hypothetical protein
VVAGSNPAVPTIFFCIPKPFITACLLTFRGHVGVGYARDHYFTVTGHTVGECDELWDNQVDIDRLCRNFPRRHQAPSVETQSKVPDEQIWEKMMSSSQAGKILRLWSGEDVTDHSAAYLALMNYLAYWTGNDPLATERLFGMSALGQREKWRDRLDYRRRTIDRALLGCGSSKFCA